MGIHGQRETYKRLNGEGPILLAGFVNSSLLVSRITLMPSSFCLLAGRTPVSEDSIWTFGQVLE